MKNLIWCKVKCLRCGRVASMSGWYSPERIKKLKAQTKDWQEHADYSIVCPDCAEELRNKQTRIKAASSAIVTQELSEEEFIDVLTKPVSEDAPLPFLEHDKQIIALANQPVLVKWLDKITADGCSNTDEWFSYNGTSEFETKMGERLSWLSALSVTDPLNVSKPDDYFPTTAEKICVGSKHYWLLTCVGQGSVSWLMTESAFIEEFSYNGKTI